MSSKIFFSLLFFPFLSFSQISFGNPDEGSILSFITTDQEFRAPEAQGSQYLNDGFTDGKIYVNSKVKHKGKLRYNAYRNEIEVSKEIFQSEEFYSLLKRPYISAEINNETYKMYTFLDKNNLDRVAYFTPKNKGATVLLYKPEIILNRGRVGQTSYDKSVPPSYIDVSSYYIKKGDKSATRIRLKKKDVLATLKDMKEEINEFYKKEKLKLNDPKDIIKLLDYYNAL